MTKINELFLKMIKYYSSDPRRIQHFTKVHSYSKLIGELEELDSDTQFILELTAVLHDIGIKLAEEKYGYNNGKLQEQEGPEPARQMLTELELDTNIIERVCYLIAHHHTYSDIDGLDYQILVEADFLVNLYEDGVSKEAAHTAYLKIFRTKSGKQLCETIFGLN